MHENWGLNQRINTNRGLLVMGRRSDFNYRTHAKLSSEVFDCMDTVDKISLLFELLDICLEELESSSKSDIRSTLLINSFFVQAKPCINKLRFKLRRTFRELQRRSI
jgi:hypothetical protein